MQKEPPCNLTENALDYLILAGEQAKQRSQRMSKHAVATLADGVELLLKARIERRDWCLVFKDIDKASRQKYESGNFASLTFEQVILRLRGICNVVVSDAHLRTLKELRQIRNQVRHFATPIEEEAASSLVAKSFAFALEFVSEHISDADDRFADELGKLRELLGSFDTFVQERMAQIQDKLKDSSLFVFDCPVCLQAAFVIEDGQAQCLFCRHETDGESAASRWSERFLPFHLFEDGLIEPPVRVCPQCGSESCVSASGAMGSGVGYVCFNCGTEANYEECISCGELCLDHSLGQMCYDCGSRFIDKNN